MVNGWPEANTLQSNLWFKNNQDGTFIDQTGPIGLDEFAVTMSYVYVDYDNDSDLDIVSFASAGKLILYENHGTDNKHIQFELRDELANRNGIGSKIIIEYVNQQQIREIKASGGYSSQSATIVHFGLGQENLIKGVKVIWSTGEATVFNGVFLAGSRYRLTRLKPD